MNRSESGFSFIELSVSLAISSAIGVTAWQLMVLNRNASPVQTASLQLAQAGAAIEGFSLKNHRLPCPATDIAGRENCASGSTGLLAWRDLGLPQTYSMVRYGVYRTAAVDLSKAVAVQTPVLPPGFVANASNGLDMCAGLRTAAQLPAGIGALTVGGTSGVYVAYALAHPGQDLQFQGINATGFELPKKSITLDYDDQVLAAGLTELSGRLHCPSYLGTANNAARAAFAAYDINRNALTFVEFRNFAYEVASTNTAIAAAGVATGSLGLIIATADLVTAFSVAANSAGIGASVIIPSTLAVAGAAAGLAAASAGLASSIIAQVTANNKANATAQIQIDTAVALAVAVANAVSADSRGLNQ